MKLNTSHQRARSRAARYLGNPAGIAALVSAAGVKYRASGGGVFSELGEQFSRMLRLLSAWRKNEYRQLPWRSLTLITSSVVYFIMPADAVPDLLPLLGLTDDAALLAWTLGQVSQDLQNFARWEDAQAQVSA